MPEKLSDQILVLFTFFKISKDPFRLKASMKMAKLLPISNVSMSMSIYQNLFVHSVLYEFYGRRSDIKVFKRRWLRAKKSTQSLHQEGKIDHHKKFPSLCMCLCNVPWWKSLFDFICNIIFFVLPVRKFFQKENKHHTDVDLCMMSHTNISCYWLPHLVYPHLLRHPV